MRRRFIFVFPAIVLFALPLFASAHEVYVLPKETVESAMSQPPLQVVDIIYNNTGKFFFWTFITIWAIFTVASISISKSAEQYMEPFLRKLKPYAPFVARITLGCAIFASGWYGAMFGPELAFSDFLSPLAAEILEVLLMVLGGLVIVGFLTRAAATILVCIYAWMWLHYGSYMLTYTNYLGEMLITLIVGNAALALDRSIHHLYPNMMHGLLTWFEDHAFFILRVAFGISLIFASIYAKFIHAELALQTVIEYNLTNYFPFDPPFLVLGAFAIELLAGLFIMFGIEVRFATLFLGFFLTLSLLYFGEAVWPHIILFGAATAIFMHGYDRYTVELNFLRRLGRKSEPVL